MGAQSIRTLDERTRALGRAGGPAPGAPSAPGVALMPAIIVGGDGSAGWIVRALDPATGVALESAEWERVFPMVPAVGLAINSRVVLVFAAGDRAPAILATGADGTGSGGVLALANRFFSS
jgi:hypothetical protein